MLKKFKTKTYMKPSVISIVLGGGRGSRLFPLTDKRSKPAVPIAGKYRLTLLLLILILKTHIILIFLVKVL